MDKINIGFIGGCINNQPGIRRDAHYHSILSRDLDLCGHQHQISLAVYLSYNQLYRQVQRHITMKKPDILFLFVRPFPMMPLQKLLIKYDKAGNKKGWALHPALFTRAAEWNEAFTANQSDNGYGYVKRSKFELRDINILLGILLGLHHWSFNYIRKQLELANSLCDQHEIKLCIISPPKNPESLLGNKICYDATRSIEKYCIDNDLSFLDINKLPLDNFEDDKLHFNAAGHKAIAKLIAQELATYIKSVEQPHYALA